MARKLRIQYPGAIYHVMSRGDRREEIFLGDEDRQEFIAAIGDCCEKTAWQVHAFCLMPNHFHLVVETPAANLSEGMKWLLGVYTLRFNRRHNLSGHLFGGRYKALIVDGSGNGYLKTVCDYVHLNPFQAGLLTPQEPLHAYRWSSYPLYVSPCSPVPAWLRVDRLLGEWGLRWDSPEAGIAFAAGMERKRSANLDQEFEVLRQGWFVGSEQFRSEMLMKIEDRRGKWHYGPELQECAQAKAERLISEALRAGDVSEAGLAALRKGDRFKVKLAAKLRAETTVTLSWIAQRLSMGSRGHLAHLLYRETHPAEGGLDHQPGLGI